MEYVYTGIAIFAVLAVLGLLAYLIVHHKINAAAVAATLGGIRDQLTQVHSVAVAAATSASAAAPPPSPTLPAALAPPLVPASPAPAPDNNPTDLLFGVSQPGDARTQPAAQAAIPPDCFVMDGMIRNGRTALVYSADNGQLFGAKPGKTTYTITIPPGAQQAQALQFNKDGVKTGKENCTVAVNGGVAQDVYQSGNNTIVFRFPGDYTFVVDCDALFTITPNATT